MTSAETYRFDEYLAALGGDWYEEDPLLQRWLARSRLSDAESDVVRRFGRAAATRHREIADWVERAENLPYLQEQDPYNERSRKLVIPAETRHTLAEIHGSGIWKAGLDERVRYAIVYLLNQNSEFGVTCSTACTDGMARILRRHGDDARSRAVVEKLEKATPADWIHGAQFVTEIQGGSDAVTNELRAVPLENGLYALSGRKWFCSNATADYWLVTARLDGSPAGHRGVSLFCVPRLRDGRDNGHVLQRLKDKLGTRALPTAEVDFEGATGWPVGPLDAGLKNMVAVVLTTSRVHCVVAAAAAVRRAEREARAYAGFRLAFGKRLEEHPLIAASLRRLREAADRFSAGAFATVDAWVAATAGEKPEGARSGTAAEARPKAPTGAPTGAPSDAATDPRLWARILVSLAKAVSTRQSNQHIYEAMMILGGNGIEERFCALPRLWRDAAILESWEGPYTLLLMQALEDMARFGVGGRETEFLAAGLGREAAEAHVDALAAVLAAPTEEENILRWAELAPRIYRSFEDRALAQLIGAGG